MPGVRCVCSLWCGRDSSHCETGDNHSRPTPQRVRPPPLLAHRRKCVCLSESSNCPVPAHLPKELRRAAPWLAETPLPHGSEELLGEQGQDLVPSAQWYPKSPSLLQSGQGGPLFFLLLVARRMREPEACCTLRKMSAFYQCVRPDPRWAPESKVVRWGESREAGHWVIARARILTIIENEASPLVPSVLCSRIWMISCLTDFILSPPVV